MIRALTTLKAENNMANLNAQLQDYLNSSKSGSSDEPENGKSYFNFLRKSSEPTAVDDTTNGWFNQAQKDPLLPGLVSLDALATRHNCELTACNLGARRTFESSRPDVTLLPLLFLCSWW